jgi:hypothetical protein
MNDWPLCNEEEKLSTVISLDFCISIRKMKNYFDFGNSNLKLKSFFIK